VETPDERTLRRSDEPTARRIRTVFGEHKFSAYTYARGSQKKFELRPIDAPMHLPEAIIRICCRSFPSYTSTGTCSETTPQKSLPSDPTGRRLHSSPRREQRCRQRMLGARDGHKKRDG
jgi:hypothetical protein